MSDKACSAAAAHAELAFDPDLQTLYSEHRGWLFKWLVRKLGCPENAADLAQDTFVRILVGPHRAELREPRAYLSTVAHGLMVDHIRRRRIERAYLDALAALPEPQVPGPEVQALWMDTLLVLDALLDGLPPKVRAAFLYAQIDDLSYAEIAERLGVSTSSVKQYLSRAYLHCLPMAQDL